MSKSTISTFQLFEMKDNNTGPACKKCNDTGYIVIRSHTSIGQLLGRIASELGAPRNG